MEAIAFYQQREANPLELLRAINISTAAEPDQEQAAVFTPHNEAKSIMAKTATPRIYVACLASYNNGDLHGVWIDCDQDAKSINKEIKAMLSQSEEEDAEEFAIHDFDDWQGIQINEYEYIDKVAFLAALIIKHGKAFAAHYNHYGTEATEETFESSYQCESESEEAFIRDQWEESGQLKELEKLGISDHWIDWEAIARDLFINSYYSVNASNTSVYIFSCI